MIRRLFTLASAVSLLVGAAEVVLWVRSHWVSDIYGFSESSAVWTDRGSVVICREYHEHDPFDVLKSGSFDRGYRHDELDDPEEFFNPRRVALKRWNIGIAHVETFPARAVAPVKIFVVVELWGLLLFASALPVMWLLRTIRRRARLRQNRCPQCGYDLRASSGRCPECATPVRPTPANPPSA